MARHHCIARPRRSPTQPYACTCRVKTETISGKRCAKSMAVSPSPFVLTSALAANNTSTVDALPCIAAAIRAVYPYLPRAFTFARYASNCSTTEVLPARAAHLRGVRSPSTCASGSARTSSNQATARASPAWTAGASASPSPARKPRPQRWSRMTASRQEGQGPPCPRRPAATTAWVEALPTAASTALSSWACKAGRPPQASEKATPTLACKSRAAICRAAASEGQSAATTAAARSGVEANPARAP
mmetsp:Transcript_84931/g.265725  ORF Transcript_84931/g.265725 Transcript_84931/m.265725 type:complete len:246 (+) Transcript_84931:218-955(+)